MSISSSPIEIGEARAQRVSLTEDTLIVEQWRIRRIFGQASSLELASIDQGLELFLGLGAAP